MTTKTEYRRPDGRTNYEATVAPGVRDSVEDLMRDWRDEGRDDERIEHIVRSAVLMAYAHGRDSGLREVAQFAGSRCIEGTQSL